MPPNKAAPPECALLAGPNGAGKSSLFRALSFPGTFINADEVARSLNPGDPAAVSLQAGKRVLASIDEMFLRRADFAYETTLSSQQSLKVLKRAKAEGYQALLIFIALDSADLHVARVQQRVSRGGHYIPEAIVRRRYDVAFDNLTRAIRLCDAVVIYDNSSAEGYRELVQIERGHIVRNALVATNAFDRRIAGCVAFALDLPVDIILPDL